ncbi:MAG: hypothetical protein R3D27_11630 [Hyphomicrobiaceae bacterium]
MTENGDDLIPVQRLARALEALAATQADLSAALDAASDRACRLIEALELNLRVEAASVRHAVHTGSGG